MGIKAAVVDAQPQTIHSLGTGSASDTHHVFTLVRIQPVNGIVFA